MEVRKDHLRARFQYSGHSIFTFFPVALAISGIFLGLAFSSDAMAEAKQAPFNLLQSIRVTKFESGNRVTVLSSQAVHRIKSFTLENPSRIVVDLFQVASPHKKEQEIRVASEWIDRVRHYGHKDKLRIVVDVEKAYLTAYQTHPMENGLIINIGQPLPPESDTAMQTVEILDTDKLDDPADEKQPVEPASPEKTMLTAGTGEAATERNRFVDSETPDPAAIIGDRLDFLNEDRPAKRFTLKSTIEAAIAANIGIKITREDTKAALAQKKSQRTGFLPTLSGSYKYTRMDEGANIGGLASGSQDEFLLATTVTQPIFTGFSLINQYKIASLGYDISKMNESLRRQDVILQAKTAYFNLLKAQKLLDISEQTVTQIEAQKEVAKNFYTVGMSPLNDFLQAEVELANAKQDRIAAGNDLETRKSEFNTLLRKPINDAVELEDILSYKPFGFKLDDCLAAAKKNRLELRLSDLEIQLAEKEVALAKKDFFPSVNLESTYFKEGTGPDLDGGAGVFDPEGWTVSATASWDIWEWGKRSYGVKEKLARLAQTKQRKTELLDQIRLEVKRAYLKNLETEINILTVRKAIEQAEENLRINQERFKEQVATTTDVLDAQTLLAETMTNYYTALYDFKISKAALFRAKGEEFVE